MEKILSSLEVIPDIQQHAQAWANLAAMYEYCHCLEAAARCKSDALRYQDMEPGTYTRVFAPPFALLARV